METLLKMFKRKKDPVPPHRLIQKVIKRAENLTPKEQAESYVSIGNIEGTLLNRDNRVIFGRRGTGKTHILAYLANTLEKNGELPILIDFRTIGSNSSLYSDTNKSVAHRATHLIRDFIDALSIRFMELYTDGHKNFSKFDLSAELQELQDSVSTVRIVEQITETERTRKTNDQSVSGSFGTELAVSPLAASLKGHGEANKASGDEIQYQITSVGAPALSVNAGHCFKALQAVMKKSGCRAWLLLDEWSSIPEVLQPYISDFIRRAILPISEVSVQIAAIEYRSRFREIEGGTSIGFELGSDIFADINLDDISVYDNNPEAAISFFEQLLFRHLTALSNAGELEAKNEKAVINAVFSQERSFQELVRASEGVPRDFLNILQLAILKSPSQKISVPAVRDAAKDWFERDKQRNLDMNDRASKLLEFLRDRVIFSRKVRAFLLDSGKSDDAIDFLFDERLLHIAKRNYSAQDIPGVRFRVWKVDYGCYVELMNTVRSPTGFLFPEMEIGDAGEIEVPQDDLRAIRRAILDLSDFMVTSPQP